MDADLAALFGANRLDDHGLAHHDLAGALAEWDNQAKADKDLRRAARERLERYVGVFGRQLQRGEAA